MKNEESLKVTVHDLKRYLKNQRWKKWLLEEMSQEAVIKKLLFKCLK